MATTDLSIPFEIRDGEFVTYGKQAYAVMVIGSSDGKREYRVDVTNGRCSCPAWKFAKPDPYTGKRRPCKHLRQFGYTEANV